MERIVIEVADTTARKWESVPLRIKNQLEKSFEQQIEITSQGIREARFQMLLDKARAEAAANGLTEEMLEKLLNEDE